MNEGNSTLLATGNDDLEILAEHRREMWIDIGSHSNDEIEEHVPSYKKWLEENIAKGNAFCFKAVDEASQIVGSACVLFRNDVPGPGHTATSIPLIFSVYVRSNCRRMGIGSALTKKCIDLCVEKGYTRITLHASPFGLPIYKKMGFKPTSEMRLTIGK